MGAFPNYHLNLKLYMSFFLWFWVILSNMPLFASEQLLQNQVLKLSLRVSNDRFIFLPWIFHGLNLNISASLKWRWVYFPFLKYSQVSHPVFIILCFLSNLSTNPKFSDNRRVIRLKWSSLSFWNVLHKQILFWIWWK